MSSTQHTKTKSKHLSSNPVMLYQLPQSTDVLDSFVRMKPILYAVARARCVRTDTINGSSRKETRFSRAPYVYHILYKTRGRWRSVFDFRCDTRATWMRGALVTIIHTQTVHKLHHLCSMFPSKCIHNNPSDLFLESIYGIIYKICIFCDQCILYI